MASLWSAGLPPGNYLAVHLSGGTTELLALSEGPPGELDIRIIGGGVDLHAGQFVDRLGVAMGCEFPAGPALEELAAAGDGDAPELPLAVTGTKISFSGPASQAERLFKQGCRPTELARAVEICLADSLALALKSVPHLDSYRALLLVGGVAANRFIRRRLEEKFQELPLSFAGPGLAGDNAVGVAVQAVRRIKPLGRGGQCTEIKEGP